MPLVPWSRPLAGAPKSPGGPALKRIADNVAWMKVAPVWDSVVRLGLMRTAREALTRVLRLGGREGEAVA